jgi:hypothetical protein
MRKPKRARALLAAGLAIALAGAYAAAARAAVAEVEPNGTLATAQAITPANTVLTAAFPPPGGGALVTGSISPGDVDYFAFDLAAGQLVSLAVVTADEGALSDPSLALFDPSGALAATDDDSGPGFLPALRLRVAQAGTWRVAVSGFGDAAFNGSGHTEHFDYRLIVAASPPSSIEANPDTNASFANADPLPAGGGSFDSLAPGGVAVVTGMIAPGDVDYWQVPVGAGRTLSAALYDDDGGALADPVLRVLSGPSTVLRDDDDGGPGFLPAVASLPAPAASSALTLAVSGFGDSNFTGSSHDESVTYQLVVALGPSAGLACDVNGDKFVDSSDVDAIFAARGQPASGPGDLRDADGDGMITVLDARACTLQCGNPSCAPRPVGASCGLVGPEALAPLLWFGLRRRRRAQRARTASSRLEENHR